MPIYYIGRALVILNGTDLQLRGARVKDDIFNWYCFSSSTIFWRCVPNVVPSAGGDFAKNFFESSGAKSFIEEIVSDISSSWKEIIYMCGVAFGLSIVMLILLRFCAGFIGKPIF